jgi:hypothetical protein
LLVFDGEEEVIREGVTAMKSMARIDGVVVGTQYDPEIRNLLG